MHIVRTSLLVAGTAALVLTGGPAQADALVEISQGHVDAVDVGYEDGELEISVHDESVEPDVERDPADVLLVATSQAQWSVPDDPAFSFLGDPGDTVWLLPEIQDENLLWPGLSAEEVESGVFVDDTITLKMKKFTGPAGMSLFTNGPNGEPVLIADSEDSVADSYDLPAGFHVHENWAFEAAGTYTMTVVACAELESTGKKIRSEPAVITFEARS